MRLFGGDKIAGIMSRFNMPEDVPLEHPLVTRAIENAQVKVEKFNFDIRKHLVEYDDVLNKQREIIYGDRRKILEAETDQEKEELTLRNEVLDKVDNVISSLVTVSAEGAKTGLVENENEKIVKYLMA